MNKKVAGRNVRFRQRNRWGNKCQVDITNQNY
jgi:hypothetical protein